MIEIRNISKTYRPRRGLPVRAIDNISLSLPERGMIFLLGRSGSGKSTLLHLLGGLDRYDTGDILVFGRSTQDFSQSELDSYRNTYVGFVFQEYNLLDELTVGANIALAIELQGRRAEDHEVSAILSEVDLGDYGARRPNELSGGQKQRVAIARALVKRPKIIMADEPSAALDEETGRSVFQMLKKLSAERLVIVVSHDREFAETYADRIIELVDGHVADDRSFVAEAAAEAPGLRYTDTAIEVPAGYRLTEEDRAAINAYLTAHEKGARLFPAAHSVPRHFVSSAQLVDPDAPSENSVSPEERGEKRALTLIRSRLPIRTAFRIGISALAHKRVRLVFTVLLSVTAFVLFGLAASMFSYDHVRAASKSLVDSDIRYASFRPVTVEEDYFGSYHRFTEEEFLAARDATDLPLSGVFAPDAPLDFSAHLDKKAEAYLAYGDLLLPQAFSGFTEASEEHLADYGYTLMAGRMPNGAENEIMISEYVLEAFLAGGYREDFEGTSVSIALPSDMLGKTLTLAGDAYTVVGIYDTDFDFERYELLRKDPATLADDELIAYFVMAQECDYEQGYSFAAPACVGEGFLDRYFASKPPLSNFNGQRVWLYAHYDAPAYSYINVDYVLPYEASETAEILWVNGEKETLAPGEVILSYGSFELIGDEGKAIEDPSEIITFLREYNTLMAGFYENGEEREISFSIVGFIPADQEDGRDELYKCLMYCAPEDEAFFTVNPGRYTYAVAPMPQDRGAIEALVRLGLGDNKELCLEMINGVMFELNTIHSLLVLLREVFLYMGIFFALFASLLFANFVGTSIVYKKREIGILRAIGSRSRDVFYIFFAEAFVIAAASFLLSSLGTAFLAGGFNDLLRSGTGILVSILDFGIFETTLLFLISMILAVLASFFPVWRIATRRPIDAIRDR